MTFFLNFNITNIYYNDHFIYFFDKNRNLLEYAFTYDAFNNLIKNNKTIKETPLYLYLHFIITYNLNSDTIEKDLFNFLLNIDDLQTNLLNNIDDNDNYKKKLFNNEIQLSKEVLDNLKIKNNEIFFADLNKIIQLYFYSNTLYKFYSFKEDFKLFVFYYYFFLFFNEKFLNLYTNAINMKDMICFTNFYYIIDFNNFYLFYILQEIAFIFFSLIFLLYTKYIYKLYYFNLNKYLINIIIIYNFTMIIINYHYLKIFYYYKTLFLKYDSWFFFDLNLIICRFLFLFLFISLLIVTKYKTEILCKINKLVGEYLFILINFFIVLLFLYMSNNYVLFILNLEIVVYFLFTLILLNNYIYEKYFFLPLINYFFFSIFSFLLFINSYFFLSYMQNFECFTDLNYLFLTNVNFISFLFYFMGFLLFFFGFFSKLGLIPFHFFIFDLYKSLDLYFLFIISIFPTYINLNIFLRFIHNNIDSFLFFFSSYFYNGIELYMFFILLYCFFNFIFIIRLVIVNTQLNLIIGLSSLFQIIFLFFISQFFFMELYILSIIYINLYFFFITLFFLVILIIKNLNILSQINILKFYNRLNFFSFVILILFIMGFPPFIGWFLKIYFLKYLVEINMLYLSLFLFIILLFFSFIYVKILFYLFNNKYFFLLENEKNRNELYFFFIFICVLFNLYCFFYPTFFYDLVLSFIIL